MTELTLAWRKMLPSDVAYVTKSWLITYMTAKECTGIDRDVYFVMYRPIVESCMDRGVVEVAWDVELPDAIIGWRCRSNDGQLLHYVHVRSMWRRCGVAKWMLQDMQSGDGGYSFQPRLPASGLLGAQWRYEPWRRLATKENVRHG